MIQKIESIRPFFRELITVDSSAGITEVYTRMLSDDISLLPIINGGTKNNGLYRRKKIFEWLIKNPDKRLDTMDKEYFKENRLPEVDMQTSLQETMIKLHNHSAILLKEGKIYSYLITPRVVANALEEYSKRFMVFESLENALRKRIDDNGIVLKKIDSSNLNKELPSNSENLEFGQYITVYSKKWNEIGLERLDKKTFITLLNSALKYRNALMHFRLDIDKKGLDDAEKLIRLL